MYDMFFNYEYNNTLNEVSSLRKKQKPPADTYLYQ